MRIYEKSQFILSKDATTTPKQVRFSEDFEDIDSTTLMESVTRDETFPVGTNSIALGNIALGKYLLVKPSASVGLKIDGGATIPLRSGKVSKIWCDFTSVDLVVTGAAAQVLVVIAGE